MNSNLIMLAAIAAVLVAVSFAAANENSAPESSVEPVDELPSVGAEKLAAAKKVEPTNETLKSKLVGFASDRMGEWSDKFGLGYLANRMSQGQSRENWAY